MTATRVSINRAKMASLMLPGGMFDRFNEELMDRAFALAVTDCPTRSGAMRASIRADRSGTNGTHNRWSLTADSPALWVHEGTRGKTTVRPMVLYAGARFVPAMYAGYKDAQLTHVDGITANPWLNRALNAAARYMGL